MLGNNSLILTMIRTVPDHCLRHRCRRMPDESDGEPTIAAARSALPDYPRPQKAVRPSKHSRSVGAIAESHS
jgi:hypothetical protein